MDKVFASPAEAVADLPDGASIALSGFNINSGVPNSLLAATVDRGTRDLCLIGNSVGGAVAPLIDNHQVSRLIVSFVARPNIRSAAAEAVLRGELTFELVPQGTLVERLRAGGAGLAGIYTPTGFGTPIAENKEVRYFDGKPFVFESALTADYAYVTAHRADRFGNCEYRGSTQHLNPSVAKCARVTIVEVDEIVEPGEIEPQRVGLPGAFVTRVVKRTIQPDWEGLGIYRRAADVPRTYLGKTAWTRAQIAERAAALLPNHSYVNLGLGIPTLISNYLNGRDISLHAENGILGYGRAVAATDGDDVDHFVHDAGGTFVKTRPGTAFFDSVTAFEMVRSGKIDVVALGAYQVDEAANLANWKIPEQVGGGIGGAMDLVAGEATVMVLMEHRDSRDRAKLVKHCTYPLTGVNCVDIVVTDLAVLRRVSGRFMLEELAPGFTADEVRALAEMDIATSTET
jgi:3-oxoacid CoA-transferase